MGRQLPRTLVDAVVGALASAPLIEALAPGKLSTVSWLKGVKDLSILSYALTPAAIAAPLRKAVDAGIEERPLRLGSLVLEGVNATLENPLIRSNTVLGYLLLAVPLSYALGRKLRQHRAPNPEDAAASCTRLIKPHLMSEDCGMLYEAIAKACSGGSLKAFVGGAPDVASCAGGVCGASVWEVLENSSYYDLNSAEVVGSFKLTRWALGRLRNLLPAAAAATPDAEAVLRAVALTHASLLKRALDTHVVREWGLPTAELVRALAGGLEPGTRRWSLAARFLRAHNVNPGSVSDVLAAAVALYLVGVSLEDRGSR